MPGLSTEFDLWRTSPGARPGSAAPSPSLSTDFLTHQSHLSVSTSEVSR